jgi:hypothetical protein
VGERKAAGHPGRMLPTETQAWVTSIQRHLPHRDIGEHHQRRHDHQQPALMVPLLRDQINAARAQREAREHQDGQDRSGHHQRGIITAIGCGNRGAKPLDERP